MKDAAKERCKKSAARRALQEERCKKSAARRALPEERSAKALCNGVTTAEIRTLQRTSQAFRRAVPGAALRRRGDGGAADAADPGTPAPSVDAGGQRVWLAGHAVRGRRPTCWRPGRPCAPGGRHSTVAIHDGVADTAGAEPRQGRPRGHDRAGASAPAVQCLRNGHGPDTGWVGVVVGGSVR